MSLLDQLRKRQSETVTSAGVQSIHVKASLLFDKKDAAKIELDAVYQLALGGLEVLKKNEPRLKPFEATLFSPSAKEMSRELQTKEANARLDESINTFLSLLAPFFLEKHTHKVLEYLIRRYSIHQFNKTAIFKCILPYHQTIMFMKMISLTKLKSSGLWEFLEPILLAGVPPKRSVIVSRMLADRNFLTFVLDMVKEAVSQKTSYRALFSFYMSSLLEAINNHGLSENLLRDLWPYIVVGLSSSDENYQTSTIMVLSTACWKAAIAAPLIQSAIDTLIAHTAPHLHSNAIRALIMIVQNFVLSTPSLSSALANPNSNGSTSLPHSAQTHSVVAGLISEDSLSVIASWTDAPQLLANFLQSQHYDTTILLSFLLTKLAEDLSKDASRAAFLVKLFNIIDIPDLVPGLTVTLLKTYSQPAPAALQKSQKPEIQDSDNEESSDNEQGEEEVEQSQMKRLVGLMAAIDLKYPTQLDAGIADMLEKYPKETKWHELFDNGRHHAVSVPSDSTDANSSKPTTLTLCLRETHPATQIFALSKLLELNEAETTDKRTRALLEKTLLDHLHHTQQPQLILNALNVQNLGAYVNAESLFQTLENLVFMGGEIAIKAFTHITSLFLKPVNSGTTKGDASVTKKKSKVRESMEGSASKTSTTLQLSNASAKLMPVTLSAMFSNDSAMRSLAGPAALQFHQHFAGNQPALPCQNVFSHYSSSLASGSLSVVHSILALAESAVAHDDYDASTSSWSAIAANPRTRILYLLVLGCALSQVSLGKIKPHPSRTAEQEVLNLARVLLPSFVDDAQTMLLSVDMSVEAHIYTLNLDTSGASKGDLVDGVPGWSSPQLQNLIVSSAFYKREYFFKYLIWAMHNLVQSLANTVKVPGVLSDHFLTVAQSSFKLLASAQWPSLFAPHLKVLFGCLGSDVYIAKFLEHMWLTPQATSSLTSTTFILPASSALQQVFPIGAHGSSTSALVCMRALAFLNSLLSSRLQQATSELPTSYVDFLGELAVGLFVPLSHSDSAVRVAALTCLSTVGALLTGGTATNKEIATPKSKTKKTASSSSSPTKFAPLAAFITEISAQKSDISLSDSFLTFALERFFHQDELRTEDVHTNVTRPDRKALQEFLILQSATMSTIFAKYSLLHALLPTPNAPKLALTADLLKTVLKTVADNSTDRNASAQSASSSSALATLDTDMFVYRLLETLVKQWQVDAVTTLNKSEDLFESFVATLHNPLDVAIPLDPSVVSQILAENEKIGNLAATQAKTVQSEYHFSLQLASLSLITPDFFSNLSPKNQARVFEHLCELILSPNLAVKEAVQAVLRSVPIDAKIIVHELQACVDKTAPPPVVEPTPPAKRSKSAPSELPQAHSSTASAPAIEKGWIARLTVLLEMLQYKHESLSIGNVYVPSLFALLRNTVDVENALSQDPSAEYIESLLFTTLITITQGIVNAHAAAKPAAPAASEGKMQVDGEEADPQTAEPVDPNELHISLQKTELAALETKYDVDCIIQIIRARSNPTLQNNALLLLSHIARVFPAKVMSNVMSIFSFMGASTERSDDNYTFNVIEKTVERVIPALLSHAPGVEGRISASTLLSVFVDRIDSIPQHRRLMLFTHILTKVLRRGYLPLVLVLLLNKHVQQQQQQQLQQASKMTEKPHHATESVSIASFAISLFHKLSPYECVSSIVYTLYWLNGFESKLERSPLVTGRTKELTANDKLAIQPELVSFAISYVTSRPFINQLLELSSTDQQRMQNVYLGLFQALLVFAKFVAAQQTSGASAMAVSEATNAPSTLDSIYKLTDKVNELMSIYTFFDAMSALFKQNDATIKNRTLLLFNDRIKAVAKAERAGFNFGEQTTENFIQFTNNMFKSVFGSSNSGIDGTQEDDAGSGDSVTMALNRQTACLTVEIVARLFGPQEQYQASFVQLTDLVVAAMLPYTEPARGVEVHTETEIKIQASLVVALATLVSNARERLLSQINKIFPALLSTLKVGIAMDRERDPRQILRQSCLAALHVVITVMHRFLSQYWPEVLKILLQPTGVFYNTAQWDSVAQILSLIGEVVPTRLMIEPLIATFDFIIKHPIDTDLAMDTRDQRRAACVQQLAKMTGILAQQLDRAALQSHHKALFKVFLTYFEYSELTTANAATAPSYSSVVAVEESIIAAFMQLTLKLNENLFKPLFLVMLDWAKLNSPLGQAASTIADGSGTQSAAAPNALQTIYTPRTHFFYRLVAVLAEELKGIFVPYFNYTLDHSLRIVLQTAHNVKKSDPVLSAAASTVLALAPANASGGLLIHHQVSLVLNGLHKLFLYDKDGFVDKNRFDRMMSTLVDQLDLNYIELYKSRVTQSIIPCLTQLAVCVGNDSLWKPLNHHVLAKSRHQDAQVRFSVLLTISDFYHRLGEAFLPLLHESTQTFAELLEDTNPEVERQCLALIKQIETVLGEDGAVMSLLSKQ